MKKQHAFNFHLSCRITLLSLISIIYFNFSCFGQKDKREDTIFQFIVMSDIQFGMFEKNKEFKKETRNFERAIDYVNTLNPEFVVMCGDLVNQKSDNNQIQEYKRIASSLNSKIPLYNVAGNHDIGNQPDSESLQRYRESFGEDYYTFQHKNMLGIVLNSTVMSYPDLILDEGEKQLKWLKLQLKIAREKDYTHIMVFLHHPLFVYNVDEETIHYSNYGVDNIRREERQKYLDLFHEYGVEYVFAGHLHHNAVEKTQGQLHMITTSALGKPLGKAPSGFRIISVDGKHISFEYFRLNKVSTQQ